ncbi:transcription factor [Fusarium tjaetaba]|uniref:Transcription factor n=1 Tax=Fusarium tjaetaba TaxID=1567544 RepID=A0A8H5VRS5_9HYPO|nr:transcription factor [Fusarium tjaetaba]KAF5634997.1 transcription factor [Fusarium tjaetaba]
MSSRRSRRRTSSFYKYIYPMMRQCFRVHGEAGKALSWISDVAALYVEAKSHQQEDAMEDIGGEFDTYLSQLGFLSVANQAADTNVGTDNMPVFAEEAQVTDRMSGSRNWFGLLDYDVSQIGEHDQQPM